jgi:hypothetical protein
LLAVAACLTFYTNKQYTELAITVITYLGVEGGSDIATSYGQQKYAIPAKIDQKTTLIQTGDLVSDDEPKVIQPGL